MGVVALVPLDVWATLAKQPVQAIGTLWDITYWCVCVCVCVCVGVGVGVGV